MRAATGKTLILAFVLSIVLTLVIAVLYFFYPVLAAIVTAKFSQSETGTGGIGAVAGGAHFSHALVLDRASLLAFLVLVTPALFLLFFLLLQRRSARD